jgi:hypothetical protein
MKNLYIPSLKNKGIDDFTTDTGIKVRRFISPILRKIVNIACVRKIVLEGYPVLEKDTPYIFASTHDFKHDVHAAIASMDRHGYLLEGTTNHVDYNPEFYAVFINGLIHVDRFDEKSRKESVPKMERIIKSGSSILMYPEGAWNITESMPVQPLFKGPYILASNLKKDGYDVKVVPIAQYQNFDDKEIYLKAGEPIDIASYECAEGITKLRDALATLKWELMDAHAPKVQRKDLGNNPREIFLEEREKEYLRANWKKDVFDEEIMMYKDKNNPYPEYVRETFDNVKITKDNAHILASILVERELDKKYDLKEHIHKAHAKSLKK